VNNFPNVQYLTLPNGIRVITQEMPYLQSATIGIQVTNGARNESAGLEGAAHFVEHLLFKATPSRSSQEISTRLDALGANANAVTDQEDVTYYATCLGADIPEVFDILADMYQNATLPPDEVEMERKVVIEEIKMTGDNPSRFLSHQFIDGFWAGSPLGHPVLGTFDTVGSVTRDQLAAFKAKHYISGNTIISVVGNVRHQEIVSLTERLMGDMSSAASIKQAAMHDGWEPSLAIGRHHERDMAQIQFYIGYRGVGAVDPDRHAQALLCQILGGSMGSRLFQEVRELRGLAYSVGSQEILNYDEGILAIACGTSPDKAQDAADLCHQILLDMATTPVSDERLADAKRLAVSRVLRCLDHPERQIFRLAYSYELYGKPRTVEEQVQSYIKPDAEALMRIARRILGYGPPRLESIGKTMKLVVPSQQH